MIENSENLSNIVTALVTWWKTRRTKPVPQKALVRSWGRYWLSGVTKPLTPDRSGKSH